MKKKENEMIININNKTISENELQQLDKTNPYNVVGAFVQVINDYHPDKSDEFYRKLQILLGKYQPISAVMNQNIKDRMMQNNKYSYIGASYFIGSTPENNYTPQEPLQIEIKENPYTDSQDGYKKLFLKSGGADNERGITLRIAKDGNYYIWSDTFMGLLSDIRKPSSEEPWV